MHQTSVTVKVVMFQAALTKTSAILDENLFEENLSLPSFIKTQHRQRQRLDLNKHLHCSVWFEFTPLFTYMIFEWIQVKMRC